jgi:regulator of replication initiation timing
MSTPKQLQFAVNTAGKNKDWDFSKLSGQFRDRQGTLDDVIEHVKQGHALCAGLLNGQWRSKSAFSGSQWVLIDIDNSAMLRDESGKVVKDEDGNGIKIYEHQLTIDEAIAHPFIQQHCALIYTTASHRAEWHKFRLVLPLPEFVKDIDVYEAVVRLLLNQLPHDAACKDGVRVFYGNTGAEFPLINPAARLPQDWIQQAIALAEQAKREQKEREAAAAQRRQQFQETAQQEGWDLDALIQQALYCVPPRTVGSGNYDECRQVLMALTEHYGPIEAEIIAEQWSPSIKDKTWNIRQKIRSFKRSGITIGTLFYIAQQYGFRFPSPKLQEWDAPDAAAYDAYVAWEREQQALEPIQEDERDLASIRQWAEAIKSRGLGFGTPKTIRTAKERKKIRYVPGILPHISQMRGRPVLPTFVYSPANLPELIAEAKAKGWKDVLDTSQTGAGKSHKYASLPIGLLLNGSSIEAEESEGDRTMNREWLLSQNHRNPSTEPAEKWFVDMPVRNDGLIEDESRQTPLGANFQRWPKAGEKPNIAGNCHLTKLFHKARSKGIHAVNETADINPICAMCTHKDYCGSEESIGKDGYGFRAQRAEVFKNETRVRSSMNSQPSPADYPAYAGDAAILDEALQQLQPVEAIAVSLTDFDSTWAELEAELPDIYEQLNPLRKALRPLVAGGEHQHYGYDDRKLRELLPTAPERFLETLEEIRSVMTVNLSDLADAPDSAATGEDTKAIAALKGRLARREKKLGQQQAELDKLNHSRDRMEAEQGSFVSGRAKGRFKGFTWTAGERQKLLDKIVALTATIAELTAEISELQQQLDKLRSDRQTVEDFNWRQRRDAKQGLEQSLDNLPMQWLVPFLEVWAEVAPGALRINSFGGLTVTVQNHRHNETLNAIGLRIYLDATATPQVLSLYRQIPVSAFLPVEMDSPKPANLEVIHVQGLGLAGKGRSESCDARITALLAELKTRHPDLVTFDWLKKTEATGADGHWFSDFTRGTNEFADRSAIAAVGLPMPNFGSFHDLWLTLTKQSDLNHLSFEDFYQQLTDAEITQAVGRLRANRRSDEKLSFYLIGDTEKSKTASYQLPAELNPQVMQARDITIEAATPAERAWKAACEFIKHWWSKTGELPNQKRVAAESGITQGYLSKLAEQFSGGWKSLKKIFQSLLATSYRDWNIFEPAEDETWIAQEHLPILAKDRSEDVAIELNNILQTFGWQGWRRILSKTTAAVRQQLAFALLKDGLSDGRAIA